MSGVRGYGWRPSKPDQRDLPWHHTAEGRRALAAPLPPSVDLRDKCPPVYDQGQLGSCTGNAIAGALEFEQIAQGEGSVTPSRLFIYYEERVMEGTVASDSGAEIRDGLKVVAQKGAPPESDWPYDIARFADKPPAEAYADALNHEAIEYARLTPGRGQLRACLAAGRPFVFGFTVYESFESQQVADTGVVQMPGPAESVVGGHAVMAVGYDNATRRILVRNSWGEGWGQGGYFTMPFAYFSDSLTSDYWTIKRVK